MTIYILLDDRFDIKYNIYTNIKIKSLSINLLTFNHIEERRPSYDSRDRHRSVKSIARISRSWWCTICSVPSGGGRAQQRPTNRNCIFACRLNRRTRPNTQKPLHSRSSRIIAQQPAVCNGAKACDTDGRRQTNRKWPIPAPKKCNPSGRTAKRCTHKIRQCTINSDYCQSLVSRCIKY